MTLTLSPQIEIFYPNVRLFIQLFIRQKTPTDSSQHSTFFSEVISTSLTDEEQTLCEGALTQKECLEALKKMESDKTPGTDGLPADFYKVFWKDISSFLISALNYLLTLAAFQSHKDEGL